MPASARTRIAASRLLHHPAARRLTQPLMKLVGTPTFHELSLLSEVLTGDADVALRALLGEVPDHRADYEAAQARADELIAAAPRHYPDFFTVEEGTGLVLYALARRMRPALCVEVGVADGRSTLILLAALDANDRGRLLSLDVGDNVGEAARGHTRWEFHQIPGNSTAARELARHLDAAGAPDLAFHDGSHTYFDQYADVEAIWTRMQPGAVLVVDNIDHSYGFADFVRDRGLRPVVLADQRKATGLLRR